MAINVTQENLEQSVRLLNQDITPKQSFLRLRSSLNSIPRQSIIAHQPCQETMQGLIDDSGMTGMILKASKPWREANTKLYYDFLQTIQSHCSELQIFNTIADFIQNCDDTLEIMKELQSKVENNDIFDEEMDLINERNTWRLIYCLYKNRLETMNYHSQMEDHYPSCISEKDVVDNLYTSENYIREYQLIIDWLEKNALDQANKSQAIEHFTDKTVAWENTVHELHNRHLGIAFSSSRPLVSSLDPDAPIRQGKSLHDLDREDDARLEKRMFLEVRCGQLQKAQALAIHCGQPWRAACLLGWILHRDSNYANPSTDKKLPVDGNPNRSLWKLCAWGLSQDKRVGQYYRAIYASLCGNVQPLLEIALSWEDALWSYTKMILDIKVESELRSTMPKTYTPMPEEYWKNETTLEDVFKELHASKNLIIRGQSNKPDHLIQKYLILDQIQNLMQEIENLLDQGACHPQLLRFLSHLILFLRQIGKNTKDKIGDRVLLAYVRYLIELGDPILVAFYTSTLPQDEQVINYAYFLENITDYDKRKKCLICAEDANLNVEAITKLVVENIRRKNIDIEVNDLKNKLTDHDMDKINALDWLTFYSNHHEECLRQANALIRYFLIGEKLDAARKAFNKVPTNTIELMMAECPTLDGSITELTTATHYMNKKGASAVREYLCYKTYLDAQEGFAEWFSHFHHGKPIPVEELATYATFTEKVAHDHKKTQYNSDLDRWKCTMQHHTKAVKQLLFNVLLFPEGGWLGNLHNTDELCTSDDILKDNQMKTLRKLCIPKITLLLLSVMTKMNEHAGCIQLADILGSEQYQLYKIFPKTKLREVFKNICESSLALMDQKKDPWGYSK